MKNLFLCLLAVGGMTLFACKKDGSTSAKTTKLKTASGYEYIHHIQNEGPKIQVGDKAIWHLVMYKNDTAKVQSTYDQGTTLKMVTPPIEQLQKPYPPTYEALLKMAKGDSLSIWQNISDLPKTPPGFLETDVLRFEIKLEDIELKADVEAAVAKAKAKGESVMSSTKSLVDDYKAGKLKDQLQTTSTGLKYIIHKEGTGNQATAGKNVAVHYAGFLTADGTPFDDSYSKGVPIEFLVGRDKVIEGWDQALVLFKAGTEATLFIPYELGYGEEGNPKIPPKAELAFFVELVAADN